MSATLDRISALRCFEHSEIRDGIFFDFYGTATYVYIQDVYVVVQNVHICRCTHVIQDVKDVYMYHTRYTHVPYKIYTCK